jgi:hypothetical protein
VTRYPSDSEAVVEPKRIIWLAVAAGAATLGAIVVRKSLEQAWRLATDDDPPQDPASHDTPWRDALIWTAANGALLGIGQLVARRGAEAGWHQLTGHYPPE